MRIIDFLDVKRTDNELPNLIISFVEKHKPIDFLKSWFEERKHVINSISFAGKNNFFDGKGKLLVNLEIIDKPQIRKFKYKLTILNLKQNIEEQICFN